MPSNLKQFKEKAFAKPGVLATYDELAEEFAFLDEVLKARSKTGDTQVADVGTASIPTCVNSKSGAPNNHRGVL